MPERDSPWGRTRALYRVFGPYLAPYRWRIAGGYAALALSVAMTLARPWPLKLVLDSVILRRKTVAESAPFAPAWLDALDAYVLLTVLCVALVAVVLLESVFGLMQKVLFAQVGHSATTDVLEDVYTHLQTLPRGAGVAARTGDVIVRFTSDVKRLRDLLVEHVQKFGSYALTFASTVAVMAWLNWRLTLLGLAVAPLIYFASYRFSKEIRAATKQKRRKEGDIAAAVQETVTAATLIQAFTQETAERERFRKEARESLDVGVYSSRVAGAFTRSIQTLNAAGMALVIWFGARQTLAGAMSPGDLVVFASYIRDLYLPIQNLSELAAKFMESVVSGERVLDLLETAPRIKDAPDAVAAPRLQGTVRFENVTFGYAPGAPVLDGLAFEAEAGRRVALAGASGAGKSTILNLLLRFYDPWSGRVTIDGRDIRGFQLRSLRSQISIVLQETALFRRTVRENIAFGKPHATGEEIVAAARAAHAHEFIEALPEGYDTLLEELGGNLSGGQRQRIALARAFLRDAPILLLDEPTTGLDNATQAQLARTLDELAAGRTTLIVAHRLSTRENADEILVLDRGRVAERGSHAQLLAQAGLYSRLYAAETAGRPAPIG